MMQGKFILILLASVLVATGITLGMVKWTTPKTAYIHINEVFNAFEMKKELEKKFHNTEQKRKSILDSLALQLQLLSKDISLSKNKNFDAVKTFNLKREEYLLKQKQFGEENELLMSQYNDQVFKQLNQYVKEYGAQHGYAYIYGADGSGVLMYASDHFNVTEEVKVYINDKYKGIK